MFSTRISNIVILLLFDILCATQFYLVHGIPINLQNNKNNYNENHANRPLLPNQPPSSLPRPPLTQQQMQQQPGININPEMEDFGRLHTNQNQFRRHAIMPPDVKVTPGAFQQNPPEQLGMNSGNNFHQKFEESLPNQVFRHQPPHQKVEIQDNRQQPHGPSGSVQRQRRHPQDAPPPHFSNSHREEAYFKHSQSFDSPQNTHANEILRERNGPSNHYDNHNPFQQQFRPFPMGQQQQPADAFVNRDGSLSNNHIGFNIPPSHPPLTAIALVIQGPDGNSTLFIEYDVSDNDVTYETTVEVEDGGEM